jgi:aminopeptidase N
MFFFSPSFDEPALKATYDITVIHPKESIALSNWPAIVNKNILQSFICI